jgi:hypothetical protein
MRCRNYKSEFFKSEDIGELSFMGRLLFLGLIAMADRRGVLAYKPKRIKAEVFPYDDVMSDDVVACVRLMCDRQMASLYTDTRGEMYLHLTNFEKHQNISVSERRQSNLNGPLPCDEGCELLHGCGVVGCRFEGSGEAQPLRDGCGTVTKHLKSEIGNLKSEGGVGETGVADAPPADDLFDEDEFDDHPVAAKARVKGPAAPGISLVAGELCGVTEADLARWSAAAPGVRLDVELQRAASWLVENPKRMKKNLRAFLGNWIRRAGERVPAVSVAAAVEKPKAWGGYAARVG